MDFNFELYKQMIADLEGRFEQTEDILLKMKMIADIAFLYSEITMEMWKQTGSDDYAKISSQLTELHNVCYMYCIKNARSGGSI